MSVKPAPPGQLVFQPPVEISLNFPRELVILWIAPMLDHPPLRVRKRPVPLRRNRPCNTLPFPKPRAEYSFPTLPERLVQQFPALGALAAAPLQVVTEPRIQRLLRFIRRTLLWKSPPPAHPSLGLLKFPSPCRTLSWRDVHDVHLGGPCVPGLPIGAFSSRLNAGLDTL